MPVPASPLRISLTAPEGKMGKALALAIAEDPAFEIDQDQGQVLIDFSVPAALPKSLERAVAAKIPIIVGTTGLDPPADGQIAEAAKAIPRNRVVDKCDFSASNRNQS